MSDTPNEATDEVGPMQGELSIELPDYHGHTPVGMKTSITGSANRISRPSDLRERTICVVELTTSLSAHEVTDDGIFYVEKRKVLDLFEIPGAQGTRLLKFMRAQYREATNDHPLADNGTDMGEEGWADANGVVLTPAELAERRGDPVALLTSATPAVVVLSNGERLLWPDEFPKDTARPQVGDDHDHDGVTVEVERLLHHETGEDLAAPAATLTVVPDTDDDDPADDDGGYSDGIEDYDTPSDDADEGDPFDTPLEDRLPTSADFGYVDTTVPKLKEKIGKVTDAAHLVRLLEAEKQGRGKGAPARRGALAAIHDRIAQVRGES